MRTRHERDTACAPLWPALWAKHRPHLNHTEKSANNVVISPGFQTLFPQITRKKRGIALTFPPIPVAERPFDGSLLLPVTRNPWRSCDRWSALQAKREELRPTKNPGLKNLGGKRLLSSKICAKTQPGPPISNSVPGSSRHLMFVCSCFSPLPPPSEARLIRLSSLTLTAFGSVSCGPQPTRLVVETIRAKTMI